MKSFKLFSLMLLLSIGSKLISGYYGNGEDMARARNNPAESHAIKRDKFAEKGIHLNEDGTVNRHHEDLRRRSSKPRRLEHLPMLKNSKKRVKTS